MASTDSLLQGMGESTMATAAYVVVDRRRARFSGHGTSWVARILRAGRAADKQPGHKAVVVPCRG